MWNELRCSVVCFGLFWFEPDCCSVKMTFQIFPHVRILHFQSSMHQNLKEWGLQENERKTVNTRKFVIKSWKLTALAKLESGCTECVSKCTYSWTKETLGNLQHIKKVLQPEVSEPAGKFTHSAEWCRSVYQVDLCSLWRIYRKAAWPGSMQPLSTVLPTLLVLHCGKIHLAQCRNVCLRQTRRALFASWGDLGNTPGHSAPLKAGQRNS